VAFDAEKGIDASEGEYSVVGAVVGVAEGGDALLLRRDGEVVEVDAFGDGVPVLVLTDAKFGVAAPGVANIEADAVLVDLILRGNDNNGSNSRSPAGMTTRRRRQGLRQGCDCLAVSDAGDEEECEGTEQSSTDSSIQRHATVLQYRKHLAGPDGKEFCSGPLNNVIAADSCGSPERLWRAISISSFHLLGCVSALFGMLQVQQQIPCGDDNKKATATATAGRSKSVRFILRSVLREICG
jgi:hypothetical protein